MFFFFKGPELLSGALRLDCNFSDVADLGHCQEQNYFPMILHIVWTTWMNALVAIPFGYFPMT